MHRFRHGGIVLASAMILMMAGCAPRHLRSSAPPPPPPPPPAPVVAPPPPPPPVYLPNQKERNIVVGTMVANGGASEFYYLPAWLLNRPGVTEEAGLANVERGGFHGPFATGVSYDLIVGTIYYFYPRCSGKLDKSGRKPVRLISVNDKQTVTMSCPR